ncbi:UPF0149 family protein [Marinobacter sp. JSM 1782161]|uniref:UPF0149 family protein n=1 Tax=Marinobacter sp. JSM 1782161 TaxID=2685906 RepID=UPI001402B6EF|nr:UPF0149 family protein [Marinobacter sp. JSM 1782161]
MTEQTTMTPALGEFETWANLFTQFKAFSHPSELHGVLCGRLAAGGRLDRKQWREGASEQMGIAPEAAESSEELSTFLDTAYEVTLEALKASDLSFKPLLPEDDYALEERLQALSSWVRGFLEGMAIEASQALGEATGEVRELVEDMVAISQVAAGEEDSEEGEQQFNEIMEYVRVGVLTVFTEFNAPEPPADKTLH